MTFLSKKTSFWLIITNIVPLAGVLFLHWDIFSIMLIYWLENIVIGFYNIGKIYKAERPIKIVEMIKNNNQSASKDLRLFVIFFFIVHFGMFTFGHGVFVFALFGGGESINYPALLTGAISLFVSHGISYYENYLGKKEYKELSSFDAMMLPYKRVVILHITIIASAFFIQLLGAKYMAVVVLVLIKIIVDLRFHSSEHKKLVAR